MLANGSKKLDDLIGQGKRYNDKRGLGFIGRKSTRNRTTVFVRECDTQNSQTENAKGKYIVDVVNRRKTCYLYGKKKGSTQGSTHSTLLLSTAKSHVSSTCSQSKHISERRRTEWHPKMNSKNCKVALTSVNNLNSSDWYFDSGCSRHMTRNAAFFSELSECNAGSVVFSDGEKGRIISKGTIDHPGLPYLLDVCLVQGLSANLISISQLCDQGYQVSFSKDRCNVVDSQNKVFLSGTRLSNNCYHWDLEVNLCNLSKAEEAGLWHKPLEHISGTSIAKIAKVDTTIGLPTLTFNPHDCCSNCPVGKQVKSSHKSTRLPCTSCILELLHINLMGPMQTESRGEKGML
ncbi:gag-pol polyprotein [Cucumis melo var. makuwa]|uniref:Gag-pol polyprotein n=1 Tax=Cucumis melo var. makuwa TaxID=1194695 RepID=A0A5A7UIE1_CUCMM|nr:gag-pol polyprotein [Cucumis melo var. makuwa]